MARGLADLLEEGERVLWHSSPRGGELRRAILAIQITGHVFLTGVSVLFAASVPVTASWRVALAALLCLCTNAPLVAWAFYRWPKMRRGDAALFVTDRRVGLLRPSGELRQVPVSPRLGVSVRAGLIEFRIGEGAVVSFGGLREDEMRLVATLVEGLVRKAGR